VSAEGEDFPGLFLDFVAMLLGRGAAEGVFLAVEFGSGRRRKVLAAEQVFDGLEITGIAPGPCV